MKKLFIGLITILVLATIASYILVPGSIKVSSAATSNTINKNLLYCLNDPASWKRWWPGDPLPQPDSSFIYNNYRFKLIDPYTDGARIQISSNNDLFTSRIQLLPLVKDSISLDWQTGFSSSYNPVKRISQYLEAQLIKKSMDTVLSRLASFAARTGNIYGFTIKRTTFRDSVLLAIKSSAKVYPTIDMIYRHVDSLRGYISSHNVTETGPPMLHISRPDSSTYDYTMAIPISHRIEPGQRMFISMMVPMENRFLETQVKGGPIRLLQAHNAVHAYMDDRLLTSPAIPFEILVTDRRNEPDTSKWMTKIFYPSM